ncbi:MAG: DsbC family protein [Thiobacillaceae bacterium]|jgi:thiol:disulfide interchange protein DsbC|nr:DsbC family protein [Thiobacillaceae bacterium]
MPQSRLLLSLVLAVCALPVQGDEAAIRQTLGERYPSLRIESVTPTPIPGLYEVWGGGKLFYADEKGEYVLIGPLVETRGKTNLTQQRLTQLRAVKFDSLPLDKAIRFVHGKGERVVAVFSDPDCPFCRKLEQELAKLDNLTVYLFLHPLPELHPGAVEVARNVWCAADPAASWRAYMLDGKAPAAVADCQAPIDEISALAARLGVSGTPALIFRSGERVDGALPAERIEALLKGGS